MNIDIVSAVMVVVSSIVMGFLLGAEWGYRTASTKYNEALDRIVVRYKASLASAFEELAVKEQT